MRCATLILSIFSLAFAPEIANAAVYNINLNDGGGVPGINYPVHGPCYCSGPSFVSNVYAVNAGDMVNFGIVVISTELVEPTPDYPPSYGLIEYVQGLVGVSFDPAVEPWPNFWGPLANSGSLEFSLSYLIPSGANSIQVDWYGDYVYTPPTVTSDVPEPSTWTMLLIGFAGIGFAAHRRRWAF